MEIRQLKYFLQVCKDKSFTKAARHLYITQQALSQSVKKLECELGISLFDRSKNGIELTNVSELILDDIDSFINHYDMLYDKIRSKSKIPQGNINIGVPPGIISYFATQFLMPFHYIYPDINLNIVEVPDLICENNIIDGTFDIACTIYPVTNNDLIFIPIIRKKSILMVHKDNPLSKKKTIRFKDLSNEKIVTFEEHFKRYHTTVEKCLNAGFTPNIIYKTTMIDVIESFVSKNLAVACLVEDFAKVHEKDTIKLIPIDPSEEFDWIAGLIFKDNEHIQNTVKIFVNYMKKHVPDI